MPKIEALIDADIVIHRIAAASEVEFDWGDGIWTLHSDLKVASRLLDNEIASIREKLGGKDVVPILCLSSPNNWRNDVLSEYKANRKGTRKPLVLKALRNYASSAYKVASMPRLEADDVMGILATWPRRAKRRVIVTIDKDLKTVPGRHFNPDKDLEVRTVTREEAHYAHMMQTLCGDSSDGYSGCPGIGPKSAEKILLHGTFWVNIVSAFEKAGLNEAEALRQAQVARILQFGDCDIKTGEVRLWTPTAS